MNSVSVYKAQLLEESGAITFVDNLKYLNDEPTLRKML
jgi:hypothetical protein